jgi:hypothetical protein
MSPLLSYWRLTADALNAEQLLASWHSSTNSPVVVQNAHLPDFA